MRAAPVTTVRPRSGVRVHRICEAETGEPWVGVFDGPDEDEMGALLVEEVGDDVYRSFWTSRHEPLDEINRSLTGTSLTAA